MGIPGGFGANLIGGLVSAMLYGITTLQTYIYYMHYSEDTSTIKSIVAATWILDTLHFSFMCHVLYHYLITNYGDLTSLEYLIWTFSASVLVNLLVITIVQIFFVHQIYYLCRHKVRWLVTAPIMLLLLVRFGFCMGMVVLMFADNDSGLLKQFRFFTNLPCVTIGVLCEVLITASLCVLLYDGGTGPVFPRTKRLLNTLIVYAVNRCVLTLLVTIVELVTTVDKEVDTWAMGLDFIMGRLYVNSLLASLNTRQYLRSRTSDTVPNLPLDTVQFANLPKHSGDAGSSQDGRGWLEVYGGTVIDVTTEPAFSETMTLRREGKC